MDDFTAEYEGIKYVGVVLESGPYGTRLSVQPDGLDIDEHGLDANGNPVATQIDFPGDEWISQQCGDRVQYWTPGEQACEQVYLPAGADVDEAENCRLMFG